MAISHAVSISDLLEKEQQTSWTPEELRKLKSVIDKDNIKFAENEKWKESFRKYYEANKEKKWWKQIDDMKIEDALDHFLDEEFDKYIKANWLEIKPILIWWDQKKVEKLFNEYLHKFLNTNPELLNALDFLKEAEISTSLELFHVELNILEDSIIKWLKESAWTWENKWESFHQKETYIKPQELNHTKLEKITYTDFDTNGDNKITDRELKKLGLFDRYHEKKGEKKKVIKTILDTMAEKELRSINLDDFTEILDKMLIALDDKTVNFKQDDGTINMKEFKKWFKETFVKTGEYKKQGIFNFNEIKKIGKIIEKSFDDNDVKNSLERLADIGDKAKNIDIVGVANAQIMLENGVNKENIFLFFCDFDSDGVVDSTVTGGERRDTGSMMWLQLYANFLQYTDTQWIENPNNTDEKIKEIIDGPKTSNVFKSLLEWVKSKSENKDLIQAIDQFLESNKEDITREEFLEFMKNGKKINKEWNEERITATYDVKEFIKSLGDELNEGRDLSEMLISKQQTKERLRYDVEFFKNYGKQSTQNYQELSNVFLKDIQSTKKNNPDFEKLKNTLKPDELNHVRGTYEDVALKAINLITDLIYADFGKNAETTIAGIFSGALIGWIHYTLYNPDGTINSKNVRTVVGKFIAERLQPSIGMAVDAKGNPILWMSIGYEKLSSTLGNKFESALSGNINLWKLFKWDIKFNINLWAGYGKQVNEKNVGRLNNKKLIPVNRIGIEWGVWLDAYSLSPYAWVFFERDFPAGIEQHGRVCLQLMDELFAIDKVFTSRGAFQRWMETRLKELADKNDKFKNNQDFFHEWIKQLAGEMERSWVFELLKESNKDDQKNIMDYIYTTYRDGFIENGIDQEQSEKLARGIRLTRFGVRVKLAEILTKAGIAATTGTVLAWPIWTLIGGWAWALVAMAKFSTFRTWYKEDINKTARNFVKIENGIGMDSLALEDITEIDQLTTLVENKLNIYHKLFSVTKNEKWNIEITSTTDANILSHLNVYFSQKAIDQNLFSSDGKKLIIGGADIQIAHNIKKDNIETIIKIWSSLSDKMLRLEGESDNNGTEPNPLEKTKGAPKVFDKKQFTLLRDQITWPEAEAIKKAFDQEFQYDAKGKVTKPDRATDLTYGKIIIKKSTSWYVFTVEKTGIVTDKVSIEYQEIIEWKMDEFTFTWEQILTFAKDSELQKAEKLIDNYETDLQDAEKENPTAYFEFLKLCSNTQDQDINEDEYKNARWNLITLLNAWKNKWKFEALEIFLNAAKTQELWYAIDRIKTIFSAEKSYEKLTIKQLIEKRKYAFKDLFWPAGVVLPPAIANMRDIRKSNNKKPFQVPKDERYESSNVFGYTAFYRNNKDGSPEKEQANKRFSMGPVVGNKVLKWFIEQVAKTNRESAKDWMIANLKVNSVWLSLLTDCINNQISWILWEQDKLSPEKVLEFLWNNTWESIDINKKIVKFDFDYVFYLMGECANESLWIRLKNITIQKQKITTHTWTGGWVATEISTEHYDLAGWKAWVYNSEYDVDVKQRDLTLTGVLWGWREKSELPPIVVNNPWDEVPWEKPPTVVNNPWEDPTGPTSTTPPIPDNPGPGNGSWENPTGTSSATPPGDG